MPLQKLEPLLSHTVFRWAAGVSALVSVVLPVVGFVMFAQPGLVQLRTVHMWLGALFLVTSLLAALSGFRYGREANRRGIFPHGIGIFVLALVQYMLGEYALTSLHIALGLLITVGAIALFTLSLRQPSIVTATDGTTDAAAS